MNLNLKLGLLLACGAAIIYFGWQFVFPIYEFRYRLSTTVEVDGKPITKSSIVDVKWRSHGFLTSLTGGHPYGYKVRGTATLLDLGSGGTLIAALNTAGGAKNGPPNSGETYGAFDADIIPLIVYGLKPNEIANAVGQETVRPKQYPRLAWLPPGAVTPKQALEITPDQLPSLTNGKVKFTGITIEPTDDELLERVSNAPHWLNTLREIEAPGGKGILGHPSRFDLYLYAIETETPPRIDH